MVHGGDVSGEGVAVLLEKSDTLGHCVALVDQHFAKMGVGISHDDFLRLVEKEMDIERDANPVNSGCDA